MNILEEASVKNMTGRYGSLFLIILALICNECLGANVRTIRGAKNHKAVVCEHKTVQLECGDHELLKIINANYGRTSNTICNDAKKETGKWNFDCKSLGTFDVVKHRCNGKRRCAIDAKNEIFGDPCVGTEKYLEINYECYAAPEVKSAVACEHKSMDLSCPSGTVIEIQSGNYGRTDETICSRKQKVLNCVQPNSLDILSDRCNGKVNCKVEAINNIFGDPCVGTEKYLEVYYKCASSSDQRDNGGRGPIHNALACENKSLNLKCSKDDLILVQLARYGRTERHHCAKNMKDVQKWSLQCGAKNSVDLVSERCDFKNTCSVPAENSIFGDPCYGTVKYLEVQYTCETFPQRKTVVACENSPLKIQCTGENQVIKILKANYGRTDKETCPLKDTVSNAHCFAVSTMKILQSKCDSEVSCTIDSNNNVFGDPCPGTYKYLEVQYECYDLSSLIDIRFGEDSKDENETPKLV